MRTLFSSPRRRRRALWIAALVLAAAAVVGVALATRHSGGHEQTGPSAPAANPAAERTVPLAAADRRKITRVVSRFVATAVARRTGASFDLVTAAFRGGTTRSEWARGDTPVYRYPAERRSASTPQVVGSYPNDVLVNLLLQPRQGAKTGPILFSLELKRQHSHWLVDAFSPLEVYSAPSNPTSRAVPKLKAPHRGAAKPDSGFDRGRLSTTWLLLPVGVFLLIVLIIVGLAIRSWIVNRRAERAYAGSKTLPPLPTRRSGTAERTTRDL